MNVTKANPPLDDSTHDPEFERWHEQHVLELSRDPTFRAEFEEAKRYAEAGLPIPGGRHFTSEEIQTWLDEHSATPLPS